jgi:hypothetical protein
MDAMRVSSAASTTNFSLAGINSGMFSFKQADAALVINNQVCDTTCFDGRRSARGTTECE